MDELAEVAGNIEQRVDSALDSWRELSEEVLTFRCSEGAWSIKEIIGHLIDSASNNHQRFVRLQLEQRLIFPDYGQDNIHWVKIQKYQDRNWQELLGLWRFYNIQLAHMIRSVDSSCLGHAWVLDEKTIMTLFDLMIDYRRHLKDHLDQINDTLNAFETR
jgi:transposase-like protein